MAITGVSAISGQQIIAAGAVSAKNAAMDSNGGYLTAKLTKASADTLYQPIGNYQTAGDYLTTGDSANFYTTANESGFATTSQLQTVSGEITGLIPTDLFTKASADTLYQPIGNYQTAGNYLTTGDSANFYTTANVSGFITTAEQTVTSTAGDSTYITAINGMGISGLGDFSGLYQAQYGTTTYNDIKNAVDNNKIVYCKSGGRMAFLAYSGSNNYEFQYYRSLTGHTTAAQGDQVFVYTINNANTWSVTTRNTYTEIKPSAGLNSVFTNGTAAKLAFSVSDDILNATAHLATASAGWDAKVGSADVTGTAQYGLTTGGWTEITAINFEAGNGISITEPSAGTVRIGTDETVLWSGASTLTAINGSANAINLSESLFNFENIAVYGRPLAAHNVLKIAEFKPDHDTEGFDWLTWFKGGGTGNAGVIRFGGAFMQYNDNKLWVKTNEFFQLSVASNGISMQSNQNIITEVIGINRIGNS